MPFPQKNKLVTSVTRHRKGIFGVKQIILSVFKGKIKSAAASNYTTIDTL
jgi:hypothetical protein